MIVDSARLAARLCERARELATGCERVFVAVSGGVDSSTVAALLCQAFGPERVVGMHRIVRSDPKHWADVQALHSRFGFRLLFIDANPIYDMMVAQLQTQFESAGLPWAHEGTEAAHNMGFTSAYASLKSRMMTPLAGFTAKAIDSGRGRVFGTGNGEEDMFLRYFDKYGDGAVDNNILNGLTKSEVRQLALFLGVPECIVTKIPSADLEACGDEHNDEGQLTSWARGLGYDVEISYGSEDGSMEGNIAWAWREDILRGVVTGPGARAGASELAGVPFHYNPEQVAVVLFLRHIERTTRHKVEPPPGLERTILINEGLVK